MGLIDSGVIAQLKALVPQALESVQELYDYPTITVDRSGTIVYTDLEIISVTMANAQEDSPILQGGIGETKTRGVLMTWHPSDLHVDDRFRFQGKLFAVLTTSISPLEIYDTYDVELLQENT